MCTRATFTFNSRFFFHTNSDCEVDSEVLLYLLFFYKTKRTVFFFEIYILVFFLLSLFSRAFSRIWDSGVSGDLLKRGT